MSDLLISTRGRPFLGTIVAVDALIVEGLRVLLSHADADSVALRNPSQDHAPAQTSHAKATMKHL